ncbi:7227_t:CDS:1, partial [Funneliformis mosseae]
RGCPECDFVSVDQVALYLLIQAETTEGPHPTVSAIFLHEWSS